MATNSSNEFEIPQEPLPVPAMDDIGPVPLLSLVSYSASDLNRVEDDSDIANRNMPHEHNQILPDELPQFDQPSPLPQPFSGTGVSLRSVQIEPDPLIMSTISASDLSSVASSFGSEEIQAKVIELIEENRQLKDIIRKNNLIMKTQYDRNVTCQKDAKDVEQIHAAHKTNLEDAKKCIETQKQELTAVKQENERTEVQNNGNESELGVAKDKVVKFERAFQALTLEIVSKNANWRSMEEKLSRYEKELENANKQIRESTGTVKKQDNEQVKLTQEKQRILDQLLMEKNTIVADLKSRNANIKDLTLRCSKLEDTLKTANNTARQYEEEINRLKVSEEQAKLDASMAKQKLTAVQRKRYKTQDELTYIRQQLMVSQKARADLEHNRAVAEAHAETVKKDIVELRRQLEENNDEMFVLRAQLDAYKADFEAEREAKEEVEREKDKIAEELQHLTKYNQQLQEQVESLR